jgi:hypothetical protein
MKVRAFVMLVLACVLAPLSASADPQELLNDNWALPSGGQPQVFSFVLQAAVPISVEMTPVSHADKGVTLGLVPMEDLDACTGKVQGVCRTFPGFNGSAVRSFSHTESVPAGRWTLFAANTQNVFFSATVHVHVATVPPLVCDAGDVHVSIDQTNSIGTVWSASRRLIANVILGPSQETPSGGHTRPMMLQFARYDSGDKTPKGEKLTSDSVLAAVTSVPGESHATVIVYPPASKAVAGGTCH